MTLTIQIPEPILIRFESLAADRKKSPADLAADLISEFALNARDSLVQPPVSMPVAPRVDTNSKEFVRPFEVRASFPDSDDGSCRWAQEFVDAAFQDSEMKAKASGSHGITFSNNYVHIERIYTRETGFIVSFYGAPRQFVEVHPSMGQGRAAIYSRMTVKSRDDLVAAIRCIPWAKRNRG